MIQFNEEKKEGRLMPGYRKVRMGKMKDGEYILPFSFGISITGKEYISLTLSDLEWKFSFSDTFYLTPNALPRIQYFYKKLFRTPIPDKFETTEQLAEHLNNKYKELYSAESEHNFVLDGEIKDNEEFPLGLRIPFKDFYNPIGFKERDFTPKEEQYHIR